MLDAAVKAREDAAAFDTSRLVEFSERLLWEGPVLQLSPLVREPGRLAITDQRVYFHPLHNIAGEHMSSTSCVWPVANKRVACPEHSALTFTAVSQSCSHIVLAFTRLYCSGATCMCTAKSGHHTTT